jgi:drug/metabolite transporter (DMT)-like permease
LKSLTLKYLLIILAVIFWGTSFIATKVALKELSPETIISLRLIIGSVFLFITAIMYKKDFSINPKSHGIIFILALIAVFHLMIQVTGLKYTTASNTGWIIGTAPIFMAILAAMFFREKIGLLKIGGIIIAMFGLLLLIGKGNITNVDLIKNKGDLLVLASAFTWGVYSMVNKKISLSYSPMMTILYLFIMMTVIIIPFNFKRVDFDFVFRTVLLRYCLCNLGVFSKGFGISKSWCLFILRTACYCFGCMGIIK